jgi:hypothetical protein
LNYPDGYRIELIERSEELGAATWSLPPGACRNARRVKVKLVPSGAQGAVPIEYQPRSLLTLRERPFARSVMSNQLRARA